MLFHSGGLSSAQKTLLIVAWIEELSQCHCLRVIVIAAKKLLTFYSKNDTLLLQDTRWQASDLAVRPSI
jgi:hypothetical protein